MDQYVPQAKLTSECGLIDDLAPTMDGRTIPNGCNRLLSTATLFHYIRLTKELRSEGMSLPEHPFGVSLRPALQGVTF